MNEEFDKALGLGEDFTLRSGETIKVFPARLIDLKEVGKLYDKYSKYSIMGLYMTGSEDGLTAFEDLLLLASNQGDLRKDAPKREQAVNDLLAKFGRIDDGGAEVRKYIHRFLGLVARDTGATSQDQE